MPQYFTNLQALHDFKLTSALPQAAQLSILLFETMVWQWSGGGDQIKVKGEMKRDEEAECEREILPLRFYSNSVAKTRVIAIPKVRYYHFSRTLTR